MPVRVSLYRRWTMSKLMRRVLALCVATSVAVPIALAGSASAVDGADCTRFNYNADGHPTYAFKSSSGAGTFTLQGQLYVDVVGPTAAPNCNDTYTIKVYG